MMPTAVFTERRKGQSGECRQPNVYGQMTEDRGRNSEKAMKFEGRSRAALLMKRSVPEQKRFSRAKITGWSGNALNEILICRECVTLSLRPSPRTRYALAADRCRKACAEICDQQPHGSRNTSSTQGMPLAATDVRRLQLR